MQVELEGLEFILKLSFLLDLQQFLMVRPNYDFSLYEDSMMMSKNNFFHIHNDIFFLLRLVLKHHDFFMQVARFKNHKCFYFTLMKNLGFLLNSAICDLCHHPRDDSYDDGSVNQAFRLFLVDIHLRVSFLHACSMLIQIDKPSRSHIFELCFHHMEVLVIFVTLSYVYCYNEAQVLILIHNLGHIMSIQNFQGFYLLFQLKSMSFHPKWSLFDAFF